MVEHDPELQQRMKDDPVGTMATVAATSPLQTDTTIYRLVVVALSLTILLSVGGALYLEIMGKTTPQMLTALSGTAIGALAGLLAPSPNRE